MVVFYMVCIHTVSARTNGNVALRKGQHAVKYREMPYINVSLDAEHCRSSAVRTPFHAKN